MKKNYDIFISYRRKDVGGKAEHLKDLLDVDFKDRISFDRENLTGIFDVPLIKRIDECKDFLLVIGGKSFNYTEEDYKPEIVELYKFLGSCTQREFEAKIIELGQEKHLDFVRIEIARALNHKDLNIIPITPESSDIFSFGDLKLPQDIAGIKRYEAVFYSDHHDALFKDIVPKIKKHLKSKPNNILTKLIITCISIIAISVMFGGFFLIKNKIESQKSELKAECVSIVKEKKIDSICKTNINWDDNISIRQLQAVKLILKNMIRVDGGTFMQGAAKNEDGSYDDLVDTMLEIPQIEQTVKAFFICKYEVSVEEWCKIMDLKYDEKDALYPMSNVSFTECDVFVKKLTNLTNLDFCIPTETEWEFAARGGVKSVGTVFSGSNDPNKVAWFGKNSRNRKHMRNDIDGGLYCNELDIYDMSGNVYEWCDTYFEAYNNNYIPVDSEAKVIRGGDYTSEIYQLTVYHRDPMRQEGKFESLGLRIGIKSY